jgi:hypothetical protein
VKRLLLAFLALTIVVSAGAREGPILKEFLWIAPDADKTLAASRAPGDCEALTLSPQAEIGRTVFRSPGLLGGPAARLGLSCEACHTNGRANALFFLPELTTKAGHADVTSEWSSKVRGDGVMNPVAIPDLAGVALRPTFGAARDQSLRHFVRGVIVEEFQGVAPDGEMLDALVAYLSALDAAACESSAPVTLAGAGADVLRAHAAMAHARDEQTRAVMAFSVRHALERIVERLPEPRFTPTRARLQSLARAVGQDSASDLWAAQFQVELKYLQRHVRATYFHAPTLRRALNAR